MFNSVNKEEEQDMIIDESRVSMQEGSEEPEGGGNVDYDSDGQPINSDDELAAISSSKRQKAQNVFRRSYKACLNCRKRKIKCDLGDLSNPSKPPCARCRREGKQCVFVESKRGGVANVRAGKEKKRKLESPSPPVVMRSLLGVPQAREPPQQQQQQHFEPPSATPITAPNSAPAPGPPKTVPFTRFQGAPRGHPLPPPSAVPHEPYRQPTSFSTDFDPDYPGFQGEYKQGYQQMRSMSDVSQVHGFYQDPQQQRNQQQQQHQQQHQQQQHTQHQQQHQQQHLHQSVHPVQPVQHPPPAETPSHETGDEYIAKKEMYNTSDALDILAHAARSFPKIDSPATPNVTSPSPPSVRPLASLGDMELIRTRKILTEEEALNLIDFFFHTMHPFYPFIPKELHSGSVLADYPILLAAILTIASRYHSLPEPVVVHENPGNQKKASRAAQIHSKMWIYCQQMISRSIWGEASSRSLGTVYAFLLFSEWNPRAIHWRWFDYANPRFDTTDSEVYHDVELSVGASPDSARRNTPGQSGFSVQNESDCKDVDEKGGLGASRRSDRLAWMMIGTAIRLAQEIDILETNPKVFIATHLSELVLAIRIGRKSILARSVNEITSSTLKFTPFEAAKLGLLQIMALSHETLYMSRETTREMLKDGKYLRFLALFTPHLQNWEEKHFKNITLPVDAPENDKLDALSIKFDYYYTRLYIFSLALFTADKQGLSVEELIPQSRYVAMATDAAREMLAVANSVHRMEALKYAPVRWVVRIVHATVFLFKALAVTSYITKYSKQDIISVIQEISVTLRDASPDDLHLASRYSGILMHLCVDILAKEKEAHSTPASNASQPTPTDYYQFHSPSSTTGGAQHHPPIPSTRSHSLSGVAGAHTPIAHGSVQSGSSSNAVPAVSHRRKKETEEDPSQLLRDFGFGLLDMDFDFFTEGTEGLGFVDPLIEGIEQHQQKMQKKNGS
ncbi:Transcriptional activator ARO80 [Yarrowia sp. E02]|nr:Transcriptional activator ARO80 [Yarrowia sp. E02]